MRRLVGAGLLLLFIAALLFLAWQAAHALLVLFAGVLFAVFLDALVRLLGQIVPGPRGVRLALVGTVLFLLFATTLVWGGTVIAQQADELGTTLTEQTQRALQWLRERVVPVQDLDANKAVTSAPTGDGSILSPAGISAGAIGSGSRVRGLWQSVRHRHRWSLHCRAAESLSGRPDQALATERTRSRCGIA